MKVYYWVQVREGLIISKVSELCLGFTARVLCLHMVSCCLYKVSSTFQPMDFDLVPAPAPQEPNLWCIFPHLISTGLTRPAPSSVSKGELTKQGRAMAKLQPRLRWNRRLWAQWRKCQQHSKEFEPIVGASGEQGLERNVSNYSESSDSLFQRPCSCPVELWPFPTLA